MSPDGATVYVAGAYFVFVVDTATETVISEITVGSSPAAFGLFITPPKMTIDDIIQFFDESSEDGSLSGAGRRTWIANRRLIYFRNMLVAAQELIEQERIFRAYRTLYAAYLKCDGEDSPTDSIKGSAVSELNGMIAELLDELSSK